VVRSAGDAPFSVQKFVDGYLKTQMPIAPALSRSADKGPVAFENRFPRHGDISNDEILDALEQTGWRQAHAAKLLGLSPPTLSRRLAKERGIQILTQTELDELLRQKETCGGDLAALARQLGVSEDLLLRRLRHT
jgi:transcriptional regulator of acetoin/glycerol metabolism